MIIGRASWRRRKAWKFSAASVCLNLLLATLFDGCWEYVSAIADEQRIYRSATVGSSSAIPRPSSSLSHGKWNSDREKKRRRRSVPSQAPPLLRQRKPYLTGSPPSRQERRCRQECRVRRV